MIKEYEKFSEEKLSDHFAVSEFSCHCAYPNCSIVYVDETLIDKLEQLRKELGRHIHINSGFRCTAHNRDVGGKKGSYHLLGKAADIHVDDVSLDDLYEHCVSIFDGIGIYPNKGFMHCDTRGNKARWAG